MVFKHLTSVVATLSFAAVISGCSYLFGAGPDATKPFVKKTGDACLKGIPTTVKAWMKDGKVDIGTSVDCTTTAVAEFRNHVSGKSKNNFTQGEVREFIAEYFAPSESSSAGDATSITEEIFNFKQILFGGTTDSLTKDELTRFSSLLLRLRPLLISASPCIRTLMFEAKSATVADVDAATKSLMQISELIAQEFERSKPGRPAVGFDQLFSSAHTFGARTESASSWLPLIKSLKLLILAGDGDTLSSHDWAPAIRVGAQIWNLFLRANYNISHSDDALESGFAATERSLRQLLSLVDQSVQAHGGSIPTGVFDEIIDALASKQLLPSLDGKYARAKTLKAGLPVIFGKLLYGRWHTDYDQQTQHFGSAQLARLHEIADDWIAGQTIIISMLHSRSEVDVAGLVQDLIDTRMARKSFADDATFATAKKAQAQLLQFMSRGRPLIHDEGGRLLVVSRDNLPSIGQADLNRTNLVRVMIEAVETGWTHDPAIARDTIGLTEPETQEAYIDLRDFGHDLNFIDVRSDQAGTRTFMENAIFMSASDGDAYMGLQEGVEWFNVVTSGSLIADKMYREMEKLCGTTRIDVLGHRELEAACFRREFLRTWTQYVPNLPRLIEWVQQDATGERAAHILTALENAGRSRGATDAPVNSSEYRGMIPILHYLESMFARHDVNQNAILDSDELWKAFPLLTPFIKKLGRGKADNPTIQRTIFSYLLEFGKVPTTDVYGLFKLGAWFTVHGLFNGSADREKVLQIIGAFPAASKNTRRTDIKVYYDHNYESMHELIVRREQTNALKITDLFQCLPDASPLLADDMAARIDSLAPKDKKIGSPEFISQVQRLIDEDPRLETFCLPF